MKIIKTSKADESTQEVTLAECLEKTEDRGYWKRGAVEQMLKDGLQVQTPFAIYEMISVE